MHTKAAIWFQRKVSVRKTRMVKTVNTSKEMTSYMILSWMSEKGPPFSTNPNRLAGT